LLKTPPATLIGARAIIEYLIEWDKECEPETSYEYLSTLLRLSGRSCERLLSGEDRRAPKPHLLSAFVRGIPNPGIMSAA
jgi:hypothetical protein